MAGTGIAFTEDVLAECRALGRARIVLRNQAGVAEAFADLAHLALEGEWLDLCLEHVHLHVEHRRIARVRFLSLDETSAAPALWFCSESGCPVMLVVLDQATGDEAVLQAMRFTALRSRLGEGGADPATTPSAETLH
jgi:hypothetical protein